MGEPTLLQKLRGFIGYVGFEIFLWSIRMTEVEYYNNIIKTKHIKETL